jgi:hypothetical protein
MKRFYAQKNSIVLFGSIRIIEQSGIQTNPEEGVWKGASNDKMSYPRQGVRKRQVEKGTCVRTLTP